MFRAFWVSSAFLGTLAIGAVWGDEFDRLEGEALFGVPESKDAKSPKMLSMGDLDSLPTVLRDSRSALLIVKTDQGNLSRLLVTPGLRKPLIEGAAMEAMKKEGKEPKLLPVVALDRFDTFDASNRAARLARGKDLMLFDGFQFDLDSGQVVPEGQGGDLQFVVKGEGGPRLVPVGKSAFFTLTKLPAQVAKGAPRPSIGRAVFPADFNGRYQLVANGQWSGVLDLKVGDDKSVKGRFRSDLNGASYAVEGEVGVDVPQKITFRVDFPRTHQDYEGLLWTEGKGAMAGTATMMNRSFGFFAIRQDGHFNPEGDDLGTLSKNSSKPHRKTVAVRKGEYALDGKTRTDLELTEDLKRLVAAEPETWVLLQVPDDETFAGIERAFEVITAAGVSTIRLGGVD